VLLLLRNKLNKSEACRSIYFIKRHG
jgi:hypothetical protein